jgi:3-dehydroquinate synthase
MSSNVLKVNVSLKNNSYSAFIGKSLIKKIQPYLKNLPSKNAFVISDRSLTVARKQLIQALKKANWKVKEIPVRAGENLKDFKNSYLIYGKLLSLEAHRDSVIFALGGGSVGDAAGFIASTYLRGVAWVGVPTTLLAQVDSALGGKTAVNHFQGKNLIGTFHQPKVVICELNFLNTLSQRELVSGLGEALKYGLIYDKNFFEYIKENWQSILKYDEKVLSKIVQRSLLWKAKAVSVDEYDNKGKREFLNFGHTFGHAVESFTHYRDFQHGEAIIWGMRFAMELSHLRGGLSHKELVAADSFLSSIPIPKLPANLKFDKLLKLLSKDKKMRQGKLHFVLLKKVGYPFSDSNVTRQNLLDAFENLKAKL